MADHGLVIPDPCIRFPSMICVYLLQREALLEAGYALDLSGHQHRTIEQERWTTFLDDSDTFAVKVSMTGRRHTDLVCRLLLEKKKQNKTQTHIKITSI